MAATILAIASFGVLLVAASGDWIPSPCANCPPPYEAPCLQILGPSSPAEYDAWLENITAWRERTRSQLRISDAIFKLPQLSWAPSAYIAPQMHPFDRYFYNKDTHRYTVQRYLNDTNKRYGGVDAILLWPTYPNMGVDDRNQFDWIRSLPGGLTSLNNAAKELFAEGVRVMLPYNPWDIGTRREKDDHGNSLSDPVALAKIIRATGSVGFNGDTMVTIPQAFYDAGVADGLNLALQPEVGGTPSTLNWTVMGWGYWNYPEQPCLGTNRWIERRHATQVCNRWAKEKTDDVQYAWFNGAGYVPWENVWGTWNGITPRGGAMIHRASAMLRFFGGNGSRVPAVLHDHWVPLVPTLVESIYASRFWTLTKQLPWMQNVTAIVAVFPIVNRGGASVNTSTPVMRLNGSSLTRDQAYAIVDCYNGILLEPAFRPGVATSRFNMLDIYIDIEPWDLGCVAAIPTANELPDDVAAFLAHMKFITARPLSSFSDTWSYLTQQIVSTEGEPELASRSASDLSPTVVIPALPNANDSATFYNFTCRGIEIEGPPGYGVDFQFPWEQHPEREHVGHHVSFPSAFDMDRYLVSNADWAAYVSASSYLPRDPYNYLRSWNLSGNPSSPKPPPGTERHPVTWVSYDEARDFCRYYGKRLPHAWEWQYAAQGTDGRPYPWGWQPGTVGVQLPAPTTGNEMPAPPNVDAFPQSKSPFGVEAMIGLVWQWTDVFEDDHTRAALLKGGSYYRPSGSGWYLRQTQRVDEHNKYLLMDDPYDRSGGVGFRCIQSR